MRTILAVSAVLLASCASAPIKKQQGPISIQVQADRELRRSDAEALSTLVSEYVKQYTGEARPLSVSISLSVSEKRESREPSAYWSMDRAYGTVNNHSVPLEGGMTPNVGYIPTIAPADRIAMERSSDSIVVARYAIAESNGKIIESQTLPTDSMHDIARFVANRVEQIEKPRS